ncbi:MAG: hypothetical protein FJY85_08730 [Deltaproteobacteria bacterium]|nr:hypothetical protein [Deltaproteobacteria bacterium]
MARFPGRVTTVLTAALGRLSLVHAICVVATTLCLCAPSYAGDPVNGLHPEDLTSLPALLKQYYQADAEDEERARDLIIKGVPFYVARGDWSHVAECYGESALRKPSVEALLGLALAESRIRSDYSTCSQRIAVELRGFHEALKFFEVGIQFREALGKKSDIDEKTFFRCQRKMVQAQKMLLDRQRKCQNPTKQERTKTRKPRRR